MIHSQWRFKGQPYYINYSTHFLVVLQKVLRETGADIMSLKSRQIPWWIYDGVYFKQSCIYQLIKNFTKNEYYLRSASRLLSLF